MEKLLPAHDHDLEVQQRRTEFLHIYNSKSISSVFQPIVSLQENPNIYGFEALTRGPNKSFFTNPLHLFTYAEAEDLVFSMEKMARESAIKKAALFLLHNQKLFLNVSPKVILDPKFSSGVTVALLQALDLKAENVIFEITERDVIDDYRAFRQTLDHYRNQGFKVAIDDAGSGYSSSKAIFELSPDFIKIDGALVQGVQHSEVKEKIVESFVSIGSKCGSKVIAEKIETIAELHKVIELGVDYGQGYLFAKPDYPVSPLSHETKENFNKYQWNPLSKLIRKTDIIDRQATIPEAVQIGSHVIIQGDDLSILKVEEEMIGKTVSSLTAKVKKTEVLSCSTSINQAAQIAAHREQARAYDDMIVEKDGKICGIVTVQDLLRFMSKT